jgi:hypothetical protein
MGGALTAAMVKLSGRPWWQAGYRDGKVISEWDTVPGISRIGARPRADIWGKSRWEDVKKAGMLALRLLTPEGMAAELQARDPEGKPLDQRFIQLRQTGRDFAMMPGALNRRYLIFQLIGAVEDDGQVECRAYEAETHAFIQDLGTGRCTTCKLERESCAGRDVTITFREELLEWAPDPKRPEAVNRERVTHTDYHGVRHPLIAFRDNVHAMRYRDVGTSLRLDLQGVKL